MKFGVTYNVFEDAVELLPYSLKAIRKHVDHVNVVYQLVSNEGNQSEIDYEPDLLKYQAEGLIDVLHMFIPSNGGGTLNEINKRNTGLNICKEAGCDYVMAMDCDELYTEVELERMKTTILEGGYNGAACQMLTYYKTDDYILDPPEDYYVPLFYKVDNSTRFEWASNFPVLVDPTRRIPLNKIKIFTRDEVQMHHYSYLRKDVRKKLINSSAVVNYRTQIDKIVQDFENFNGEYANSAGKIYKVRKLESPPFKISI